MLGVNPDAPDEVIRAAYRALAAKYHPDRNPGNRDSELKLKQLNAAWAILGDPAKRKQYDDLTRSPEAEVGASEPPNGRSEDPAGTPREASKTPRDATGSGDSYKCPHCGARLNNRTSRFPACSRYPDDQPSEGQGPKIKPRRVLRSILRVVGVLAGLGVLGVGALAWYDLEQSKEYKAQQAAVTIARRQLPMPLDDN